MPQRPCLRQRVPTGGEFDFNLSPGYYVIDLQHYVGRERVDLGFLSWSGTV